MMKRALAGLVLLAGAAGWAQDATQPPPSVLSEVAAAEEPVLAPRYVLSLHIMSVALGGAALQLERHTASRRFSAACTLGGRVGAGGDYSAYELTAGAELRWWFPQWRLTRAPRIPFLGVCDIGGLYVGARFEGGYTRTSAAADGRFVGSTVTAASWLSLGYRFPIRCRVEITPSISGGAKADIDTRLRLAVWPRFTAAFGLTVGVIF